MPSLTEADLLADLTPAQRDAVTHIDGPLLVLAGAGSGKTRVITRRVAYLLLKGVPAGNILAITFTNKAAGEMKQRVEALLPGARVWISTFHALGARLLRMYADRLGLDRNFTIYDQSDRARVVKMAMEDAGIDEGRLNADALSGAISKAKNQLLSPDRYAREKAIDFFSQTVAKVYPAYEARLKQNSALDFDDLLYWPALALKNNAELRTELDAKFRYVLIDEYQDTNQAQYAIARGLTVDYNNICVVGDPDQSIYKWRGSDIRNILDFERDYPTAKVLTLSTNYRSTKNILLAASSLIAHNKQRKPKDLVTDNPEGDPVTVCTYETGHHEAAGIASTIQRLVQQKKRSYRDCAVFLRVNALSRTLEIEFTKARVPYQIVKGLAFFERKENKDILGYLRLLMNPNDDISFLRIVNEPARGIGKISLEHLKRHAEANQMSLLAATDDLAKITLLKGKAALALRDFNRLMHQLMELRDGPPDEIIRQVLDKSGYRAMLQASTDEDDADRLANIEEMITAATEFVREDPTRKLGDFLENITLASDVDGWNDKQDCVSIMTMHAAKGLEFPVVFLTAMEQGLLPHERSLGKVEDIEEERRLAFVGLTRAKEQLFVSFCRLREFRGSTVYAMPSMFLSELPPEAIREVEGTGSPGMSAADRYRSGGTPAARKGWDDAGVKPIPMPIPTRQKEGTEGYVVGMVVRHATYGEGQITEVVGNGVLRKVKIRFRTAGERSFIADKVMLEILRRPS